MSKLKLVKRTNAASVFNKTQPRRGARGRILQSKRETASDQFMDMAVKRDASGQLTDPFDGLYGAAAGFASTTVLQPIYDPAKLILLAMQNSTLNQCVDAYMVNIESYGYQLEYVGPSGQEDSDISQEQKREALAFLDNPNGDTSLRIVREHSRKDKEYTGTRYFECGRDALGRISFFDHVPSLTMRMTKKDRQATPYIVKVPDPDGDGFVERLYMKHFRRFVQVGSNGAKVFFKEFGDPRAIDPDTGNVTTELAVEDQATEIYQDALYFPGTPYGVPRWIGAMLMILAGREAELVNLNYFRENAVPAMAVLISGGALTAESFDSLTNIINAARGQDAMNRILVLEASSEDAGGEIGNTPPAPKIELTPMGDKQRTDGQFKEFRGDVKQTIRSSMRLPALYTGDTEEYTKATADAGQRVVENQVFGPERSQFDDFINTKIFPTYEIDQWRFKSMGPTIYDPESLSAMIDRFSRHGALTPNILIKLANQVFDVQIDNVGEKWGDIPFVYTMAHVQNGREIEGFEEIFAKINDTSNPALNPEGEDPAANDNSPEAIAARMKKTLRKELHNITTDLIDRIDEYARGARAA